MHQKLEGFISKTTNSIPTMCHDELKDNSNVLEYPFDGGRQLNELVAYINGF